MVLKKVIDAVGDRLYNLVEEIFATVLPNSPPSSRSRRCDLAALTTLKIPHVDLVPIGTRTAAGSRLEGYAVQYRGLPVAEMYATRFLVIENGLRQFSLEMRAEIEENVFTRLRGMYI